MPTRIYPQNATRMGQREPKHLPAIWASHGGAHGSLVRVVYTVVQKIALAIALVTTERRSLDRGFIGPSRTRRYRSILLGFKCNSKACAYGITNWRLLRRTVSTGHDALHYELLGHASQQYVRESIAPVRSDHNQIHLVLLCTSPMMVI